jgi:hypothetical protein
MGASNTIVEKTAQRESKASTFMQDAEGIGFFF